MDEAIIGYIEAIVRTDAASCPDLLLGASPRAAIALAARGEGARRHSTAAPTSSRTMSRRSPPRCCATAFSSGPRRSWPVPPPKSSSVASWLCPRPPLDCRFAPGGGRAYTGGRVGADEERVWRKRQRAKQPTGADCAACGVASLFRWRSPLSCWRASRSSRTAANSPMRCGTFSGRSCCRSSCSHRSTTCCASPSGNITCAVWV